MAGYVATLDFFRRYPQLITILLNIHHHVKDLKYDFPFVICGDNANGKSMLLLHIIEIWYRIVLQEEFNTESIRYVQNTRRNWILNFKNIRPLDINANDEGADGLMSKESMSKFGREVQKLYMVFRKKLFITPIVIPDFFDLPPYFRKRVRGLIWVNKRGRFKYYTMRGIKYLNAYNDSRTMKSMHFAYPRYNGSFPDYQGVLRKPYDDMSEGSPDTILDELISDLDGNASVFTVYFSKVKDLIEKGVNSKEICKTLHISNRDVSKIRRKLVVTGQL